ncbi:sporulation protein YhbH [Carboxydochorda subterranea]|uniref:Sporulation protein YhbH n=1 Tax=Carboxydichorda subterranea TaxID=3109565 RepID=A0ABZ1BYA0_9FIRM|nr:sporulation protein YhbH [Limnochorda sp. L945t]WRP17762.1 sporulation protein YhbH [Limnochorda sp. L945t]
MESVPFLFNREDWSLHRKGQLDQQRHQQKVKEAIRKNLADLVAEESIILSDGKKVVKVPVRSLEEYRFRFDPGKQRHVGHGSGSERPGDVIARDGAHGKAGKGPVAGDRPGFDYYEAEVTIDELAELIFEDLGLPNLQQKRRPELVSTGYEFNDVRRHGAMANLDKRRTLLEAFRRNALAGEPAFYPVRPEDLRFKTWDEAMEMRASAVVLAMMDTSGSMGTFEKYIARSFYFWMVRFLRTKYHHVQIVFIAHDTKAKEVTEEEFFTKGESGGTKCSSAYELALSIIEERFPPDEYNIYAFHFSDGDNFPSDNSRCVKLVGDLLERASAVGYGEIVNSRYYSDSTLMSVYQKIEDPRFVRVTIRDKSEVYPALRAFFRQTPEREVITA